MHYHLDPSVDWSEVTHSNITSADRSRHNGCQNERLDLLKRLRWKALIRCGLLTGWRLTERNVMIQDLAHARDPSDYYGDDENDDEMMEAVDEKDIQRMVGNNKENDDAGGCVFERIEVIDGVEVEASDVIGYELRRSSGSGPLGTIPEEPYDEEDEVEVVGSGSFQIASSTDTSTTSTTSEASTESNTENVQMGSVSIGYIPEEAGAPHVHGSDEESEKKENYSAVSTQESNAQIQTDGAASLACIPCDSARAAGDPEKRSDIRITLTTTVGENLPKKDASPIPNDEQSSQNLTGVNFNLSAQPEEQQNHPAVNHANARQTTPLLTQTHEEAALGQPESILTEPRFILSEEEIVEENESDASTEKVVDEKPTFGH
ncbi:hypothetical protein TWF694_000397 [Orbilia ellipsospora]|uniref:Uncharacterized protein n=1 Tax=Orbilia ellipsospora TaxID=2528407 RepID=A0AAV9XQ14_9PEZI